ncbi:MAG: cyclic-di-AMP receptor [Ruminococcus sp.]
MKMILGIMKDEDSKVVTEELNNAGYMVTKLSSTGGFLKQKSTTLLIGTDDEKVEKAIEIIKEYAGIRITQAYTSPAVSDATLYPGTDVVIPVDVQTGGCTIFVVNVEDFKKC